MKTQFSIHLGPFHFENGSCQNISKKGRVSDPSHKIFQKCSSSPFPQEACIQVEDPVTPSEKIVDFSQPEDLSDDFNCGQFQLNRVRGTLSRWLPCHPAMFFLAPRAS